MCLYRGYWRPNLAKRLRKEDERDKIRASEWASWLGIIWNLVIRRAPSWLAKHRFHSIVEAVRQRFQNLEMLRSQCGASGSAQHHEEKSVEPTSYKFTLGQK